MNYRIIYRFIIFSISVTTSGLSCAIVDSKSQTYSISDVGEENAISLRIFVIVPCLMRRIFEVEINLVSPEDIFILNR